MPRRNYVGGQRINLRKFNTKCVHIFAYQATAILHTIVYKTIVYKYYFLLLSLNLMNNSFFLLDMSYAISKVKLIEHFSIIFEHILKHWAMLNLSVYKYSHRHPFGTDGIETPLPYTARGVSPIHFEHLHRYIFHSGRMNTKFILNGFTFNYFTRQKKRMFSPSRQMAANYAAQLIGGSIHMCLLLYCLCAYFTRSTN